MNQVYPQSGLASLVASRGRNGDSMLIHMAPEEVRGLQALALAHGGSLTINPDTGLYEASFLKKLLPTLIGFGLSFIPGVGPLMAAGLVGAGETIRTGDLGKGLMAGFGAYGGAGLSTGLAGAGQLAKAGADKIALQQTLGGEAAKSTLQAAAGQAAKEGVKSYGSSVLGGVSALKEAGIGAAAKGLGSTLGSAGVGSLGSTALNVMTPEMKMPKGDKQDNLYYISGGYSDEEGFAPGYYTKQYPGLPPPGMAMGGAVPRPNPSYPMANLQGASAYAAPLNFNQPSEVISGYDAKINPMTGQEIPSANFAEGGGVEEAKKQYAAMLTAPAPAAPSSEGLKQYMAGLDKFLAGADKAAPTYIAPPPPPPKPVAPPPPAPPPPPSGPPDYGPIDFSNLDLGMLRNYGFDPDRVRQGLRNFGYTGDIGRGGGTPPTAPAYVPPKYDPLYREPETAAPAPFVPTTPAAPPPPAPPYWKGADLTPDENVYQPQEPVAYVPEQQTYYQKNILPDYIAPEPVQEFVGTPYMPEMAYGPPTDVTNQYPGVYGPTTTFSDLIAAETYDPTAGRQPIERPVFPSGDQMQYAPPLPDMGGLSFAAFKPPQPEVPPPSMSQMLGGMPQQAPQPMSAPNYGIASVSPYAQETLAGLREFRQMQEVPSGAMGEDFNFGFAGGGPVPAVQYAAAGKLLRGPGDGMSDDIPANIDGKQEARLADGEFVIPADVVSHLGNGSSEAGSKQLYAMMDRIRQARTGRKRQAPEIDAEKYLPA